ncbi:uncharacterized protein [Bactrocera oleae]|uniref:uncharacterized protein isoform X1 n=1 Tax=Bactrocera oleae TaxID=104688 RepID=UPI00387ED7D7
MVSCDAGGGTIILGSSASLASSDDGNPSEEDDDDSTDVDNVEELAADHDDVICIMRNPSSQVLSVLPTCQRSKSRSIACLRLRHHTPIHNALESHVEAAIEALDNAYCEDYGLSVPDTFDMCGQE